MPLAYGNLRRLLINISLLFYSMKKLLITLQLALAALAANAQGTITLTTSAAPETPVKFTLNVTSALMPVMVDFGDGNFTPFTVDPSLDSYYRFIEGTVKGETIRVKGYITEFRADNCSLTSAQLQGCDKLTKLELDNNEIVSFKLLDTTPLEHLDLSHNNVTNTTSIDPDLTLSKCGSTLKNLNMSYNPGFLCLDMRNLSVLEYFTANDCPDLGSVFICLPEEEQSTLLSINLDNCNLAHFYPVSLPQLRTLYLANNNLVSGNYDTDPFILGDYPKLMNLDVSGNKQIYELDITSLKNLEQLHIGNCNFSSIDLSQAPELVTLSASNNHFESIDLGNNKKLANLYLSGNPITELDFTKLPVLANLEINDTQIARAELMNCYFLKNFKARNTRLEFVNFNGQQPERMEKIDLRDNPGFTYQSMAFTIKTLPVARTTYNPEANLLLSGTKHDKADIAYATGEDMHWICDVTGDGSADFAEVPVTFSNASLTGDFISGTVDRLYPNSGFSLDYDLDMYATEGGRFVVAQWEPEYFQTITSITDKARRGVPICIYTYPAEGNKFKSVEVNGKEIESEWFFLDDDVESADIKVNFSLADYAISFTTDMGRNLSFCVSTLTPDGTIDIDWGTGVTTKYTGVPAYKEGSDELLFRISGMAASETVTIYGDVVGLDISGYGDVAEWLGMWDNHVTALDLSKAAPMRYLNTYNNPITEIDLSRLDRLEYLDMSWNRITELDLSGNPLLRTLRFYAGVEADRDKGVIRSIDLSRNTVLEYLDLRNQRLSSLDLSNNEELYYLALNNNDLESIDLSHNEWLEGLSLTGNKIAAIDLSRLSSLTDLAISDNELTELNLRNNPAMQTLAFANNRISADKLTGLSQMRNLRLLYLNGNGFTAGELNDIYYSLPQRRHFPEDDDSMGVKFNLFVVQSGDRTENAGSTADSSIAVARGWNPTHSGVNLGCDVAYFDIAPAPYGKVNGVRDARGNLYTHGSKISKYIDLTIDATPDPGYKLSGFTLNGEGPFEGGSFMMPGIYTTLTPVFTLDAGVEGIGEDAASTTVKAVAGGILVAAAESATIHVFNASGAEIAQVKAEAGSTKAIATEAGVYLVRVAAASGTTVSKVAVK